MSTDALRRLRAADPGDVQVAVPENLLAELLASPRPAPPPRRALRRPAIALAGAAALVAGALAVALPGGATDARADLLAAAQRTADVTSGRITWHIVTDPPLADFHSETLILARFDGADTEFFFQPGGEHAGLSGASRYVDGRAYNRVGNAAWREDRSAPSGNRFQDELHMADALAAIVRAAPGVQRQGDVFHAQIDSAALPVYAMGGPKWPPGPVQVDVTVAEDGTVGAMDLHVEAQRWEVTFSELGEPQDIKAP